MKVKLHSLLLILILSIFALSSCKMRAEQKSLTGFFGSVDALIEDGRYSQAMAELKKAEKRTFDEWGFIAIYKRYMQLGEKSRAEKIIQTGIKKNSKSLQLVAIYTNFLLRENRLEDAAKYAIHLKNTKFGSFYSEVELRQLKADKTPEELTQIFKDKKYYNIYLDAYKGSKDGVWLRNCVLFNLKDGLYQQAAALYPNQFNDADDAYFWGLVLYDSGRYSDAVNALEASRRLLGMHGSLSGKLFHASEVQQIALESDAYIAISDMEKAHETRQIIIEKLNSLENLTPGDMQILSSVTLNSAIYAQNTGNDEECSSLLKYLTEQWPDLYQGLVMYANFAYKSNTEREESFELQELRKNGLATLEMEAYDNRPKLSIEEAIKKINASLENKMNPYLEITKLDLKYRLDSTYSIKEKTADLWNMLEENYTEEVKYESLLVQYALSYLLKTKQNEDAYNLFRKHIAYSYKFDPKKDFWSQLEPVIPLLDVKMQEFAAIIAFDQKKFNLAYSTFEFAVYGAKGNTADSYISPFVTTGSCMNLADIYYSVGARDKAIDLYGKAAGRESSAYLRSEIFYRVACIYSSFGNKKDALKALDYALSIYPNNTRASLLKTKLK